MSEARQLARRRRDWNKGLVTPCTFWHAVGREEVQYGTGFCFVIQPSASQSPYQISQAMREAMTLPKGRVIQLAWDADVAKEKQVRTAQGIYRIVTVYDDYSNLEGKIVSAELIKEL